MRSLPDYVTGNDGVCPQKPATPSLHQRNPVCGRNITRGIDAKKGPVWRGFKALCQDVSDTYLGDVSKLLGEKMHLKGAQTMKCKL